MASAADAELTRVLGTNLDGVDGSEIPGGCHAARYGGGDGYAACEPILSLASLRHPPSTWSDFPVCAANLAKLRAESLQWPSGYTEAGINLLGEGGEAPPASHLQWEHSQLLVTRAPDAAGDYFSLMLHGWLFRDFAASGRKAHQKFPLLACFGCHNLAEPEASAGPDWLRLDGSFCWADQHVHRDEPIDLGGFMFSEVFAGADMARVRLSNPEAIASFHLASVDLEAGAGLHTVGVILPPTFSAAAEANMRQQPTVERIAALLAAELPAGNETSAACAAVATLRA